MTERSRNIAVGLTAMAGLASIGVLLILFGYLPQFMRTGYTVRVQLANAASLQPGSGVTYNGITIGSVDRIELLRPPAVGVIAVAYVREGVELPANVRAYVSSPILGGSTALAFVWDETDGEPVGTLPTDNTATVQGEARSLTDSVAGQLSRQLEEPLRELHRVSENFAKLSEAWTQVGDNINQLVKPRTIGDVDDRGEPGNLATLIDRADARMAEMEQVLRATNLALESVQGWLDDEQLRADVSATAANARKLTENLNEQIGVLSRRYVAVADDLTAAIQNMNRTIELARTGDGTVGKLLNDPSLYNNLNDAAARLNLAMEELNLLMEKMREEGLPLQLE